VGLDDCAGCGAPRLLTAKSGQRPHIPQPLKDHEHRAAKPEGPPNEIIPDPGAGSAGLAFAMLALVGVLVWLGFLIADMKGLLP
jgi:hypothetical protein